MLRKSMKY